MIDLHIHFLTISLTLIYTLKTKISCATTLTNSKNNIDVELNRQ